MEKEINKPVILFDGVCNLCNGAVQFVVKRDKNAKFLFTSLQSDKGQQLLKERNLPIENFDSFILLQGNDIYKKSDAAFEIIKNFSGVWRGLYVFKMFPKSLRDMVYDFVSRNRYKFFGKHDRCMLPSNELKQRFI